MFGSSSGGLYLSDNIGARSSQLGNSVHIGIRIEYIVVYGIKL